MVDILEEYYLKLYTLVNLKPDIRLPNVLNANSEVPDIIIEELKYPLS